MANLTIATPSIDGFSANRCVVLTGLLAGETIAAGNAVYVKSDGKVWRSVSTVKDTYGVETGLTDYSVDITRFEGVVNADYVAGEPCTVFGQGAIISKYSTGMTIGASYFVSETVGLLADAQVATGDTPVARSISATDILIVR